MKSIDTNCHIRQCRPSKGSTCLPQRDERKDESLSCDLIDVTEDEEFEARLKRDLVWSKGRQFKIKSKGLNHRGLICGVLSVTAFKAGRTLAHEEPPFVLPQDFMPTPVDIGGWLPADTINVFPDQFRLYLTLPGNQALRYTVTDSEHGAIILYLRELQRAEWESVMARQSGIRHLANGAEPCFRSASL